MKWLFQQAKRVPGSKRKEQIQDKPQGSRDDVTTVSSGDMRKNTVENG